MKNQFYYMDFSKEALAMFTEMGYTRCANLVTVENYTNTDFKLFIMIDMLKQNFCVLDNEELEEKQCYIEIKTGRSPKKADLTTFKDYKIAA